MQTMLVSRITPYNIGPDEFEFQCSVGKEEEAFFEELRRRVPEVRARVFREDFLLYASMADTCEVLFCAYPKSLSAD